MVMLLLMLFSNAESKIQRVNFELLWKHTTYVFIKFSASKINTQIKEKIEIGNRVSQELNFYVPSN